jgi:hypothetical protein
MLNITTNDGQAVQLHRTHLVAQHGPHAGRTFRIDDIVHEGGRHLVVATRKHNSRIRHTVKVLPEIFGIVINEIEEIGRQVWTAIKWVWLKVDEGLYMGTAALIPLAYFEHYDLATKIVEFFNTIV